MVEKRKFVLVGGGHTHALALDALARRPEPGMALTLVSPHPESPYSGMLPGHIAGVYSRAQMHVDLMRLCRRAGATFVQDAATRFDAAGRSVHLASGAKLGYDVLSIDIGVTPDLAAIPGAARHAVAAKPIAGLLERVEELAAEVRRPTGPRRIVLVGGGAAGLCLAFALAARLRREAVAAGGDPRALQLTLVTGGDLLPGANGGMRRAAKLKLAEREIAAIEGSPVVAVEPHAVVLGDGRRVAADATLVAVQAYAPGAIAASDLARTDGFLATRPTLQVEGRDDIFAVGDCATIVAHPRPKAGVFAVRQAPVLTANLRALVRGEPLREFIPQKRWLMLISAADGTAIGGRGHWFSFSGRAAWWLKDLIDRRFMRRFA